MAFSDGATHSVHVRHMSVPVTEADVLEGLRAWGRHARLLRSALLTLALTHDLEFLTYEELVALRQELERREAMEAES